ncbi:efflux RND transporter periplasmic adaptor subunit [Spirochaeta cellobiosiphila]|uniref:efflux RND transporter periplasmic adaptor subunit n=1 Tax=Spirochaeta cellobiosiphila TaxID=504483 RepID=UPI0003FAACD8|nr:efflux RND transporter periplasmic adaptor subunit [Spirochaeta cellobiosiphila]
MKKQLLIALTIASLVMVSCKPKDVQEETKNEVPAIKVRTTDVVRGPIQDWIALFGDVQAKSTISVMPDTSGKIHAIYVSVGDYVRKGQKIADIDPSRPGLNYSLSPVNSPITGTVTSVTGEEGAMTSPQSALAKVGILDNLEIELQVPEKYVFRLSPGREGVVTTDALPGFSQRVQISEISPVINPLSRTATVKLKLIDNQGKLKPGMYVDIRLLSQSKEDVVITSEKALLQRDEDTYVYKITDGKAELVKVDIGIRSEGKAEIVSGLSEGDKVITSGKNLLYNGAPISVMSEEVL